jgi:hypothetical protein
MSGAIRELRIIEGILKTNLPAMGWPESGWTAVFQGVDGNGDSTLYVNATHAFGAVAGDDVACFVRLKDYGDVGLSDTMRTQDHAYGLFVHSGCVAEVIGESPALWTTSHAKLIFDVLHILRGVYGSALNLYLAVNTTVPAVKGINSAGADANIPSTPVALAVCGRSFGGGL